MLNISLENFGPVSSGSVSLSPLTILVGPNNAGKSYVATLLYSVLRATAMLPLGRYGPRRLRAGSRWLFQGYFRVPPALESLSEHWTEVSNWLSAASAGPQPKSVAMAELPSYLQDQVVASIQGFADAAAASIGPEIERCFGATAEYLRLHTSRAQPLKISGLIRDPVWEFRIGSKGRTLAVNASYVNPMTFTEMVRADSPRYVLSRAASRSTADQVPEGASLERLKDYIGELCSDFTGAYFKELSHGTYYLPAGRGGIIQSHRILASILVAQSPMVGIENLQVRQLSGVFADFISLLLVLNQSERGPLADLADELEEQTIMGTISFDPKGGDYPEIVYSRRSTFGTIPLHRASSMVSELAPVALLLRYVLRPGDVLIIEEPESHLHPAIQVKLVGILAKLVQRGARIVITTHSDFMLSQINNCITRHRVSEAGSQVDGTAEPSIAAGDVSAYLVAPGKLGGGSHIRQLKVNPQDGIQDAGFVEVTESLYNDAIDLEERLEALRH